MPALSSLMYCHVRDIPVPSEIIDDGIRRTVTYKEHRSGGGAGMGEFPSEVMLVLDNGKVIKWDSWSPNQTVVSTHGRKQKEISF